MGAQMTTDATGQKLAGGERVEGAGDVGHGANMEQSANKGKIATPLASRPAPAYLAL
jgi:hypothetical protein